jgi:hypothetical protein
MNSYVYDGDEMQRKISPVDGEPKIEAGLPGDHAAAEGTERAAASRATETAWSSP